MDTVLLAGASGALGKHVAKGLKARGFRIRALSRNPANLASIRDVIDEVHAGDAMDPRQVEGACKGVRYVFSCLGASVNPAWRYGRKSFGEVDYKANRHLVAEATAAKVERFGYVSLCGVDRLAPLKLDYVIGHEQVVDALRTSGLNHVVIRPTGFFSAMDSILAMAAGGKVPQIGEGSARTNPIHDEDLADVCVDSLLGSAQEVTVGGPQVFTRREIAELAFSTLGKSARFQTMPVGMARFMSWMLLPFNPRMAHLLRFFAAVTTQDMVAPAVGKRTLEEHFRQKSQALSRS